MNRRLLSLAASLTLVAATGCDIAKLTGTEATTSTTSSIKTYESIWINSNWSSGAAGAPEKTTSVVPNNIPTGYCNPSSLILSNHGTTYQSTFSWSKDVLVFKNNCTAAAELMVCITAPGPDGSEFPACNVDPRTTPFSRLKSVSMGSANGPALQATTWRETKLELHINVFYCGVGDTFAAGIIAGAKPTDCIKL